MGGLSDVESIGTNVQGQKENAHTRQGLESTEASLNADEGVIRDYSECTHEPCTTFVLVLENRYLCRGS